MTDDTRSFSLPGHPLRVFDYIGNIGIHVIRIAILIICVIANSRKCRKYKYVFIKADHVIKG